MLISGRCVDLSGYTVVHTTRLKERHSLVHCQVILSRGSYCVVFITNITDSIVQYLLCCTHSTAGDCVWHALASRHFFLFSALWGLMLCAVVKSPEIFYPQHFGLACKILLKLFLNCLLFNQNVKLKFIVAHRLTKIWGAIEAGKFHIQLYLKCWMCFFSFTLW